MRVLTALALPAAAAVAAARPAAVATDWSKPPRGFNAWFAYDVFSNETVMRANAAAMVSTGLAAKGFIYVNLDGGWQGGRFPNGTVYANTSSFPSGMPALADYVHSLGLLFGSYTDRGAKTCDNHVGSAGYEVQDAQTYAEWGVDYVKSDSCDSTMSHEGALGLYQLFQSALQATDRPIYFSLCGWLKWYGGSASAAGVGQSWRIGPDALSWQNVLMNMDSAADCAPFAGPGKFCDVDEIMGPSRGRPISFVQTQTQFNFIALVGSPLLLSFDLSSRNASDPDVAMILNDEVLAVHWDDSLRFRKLRGGPLGVDRISPYTNLTCNASEPAQQWAFLPTSNASAAPASGYLQSVGAPGWCLMTGAAWYGECNNAQQVWLGPCGTGCCGPECNNMQFQFAAGVTGAAGTMQSLNIPTNSNAAGALVTLDSPTPNSVFLEEQLNTTAGIGAQQWVFDTTGKGSKGSGVLMNAGSGTCVGAVPRDTSNVWVRYLADGSAALLLMNVGPAPAAVTCDAGCMSDAGFASSATLAVRDLVARTDNGTVTAGSGLTVTLGPNGASAFVKLTPQ